VIESQTAHITRPGDNRTGIAQHPDLVAEMIEGTTEFGPTSRGGVEALAGVRVRVAKDSEPAATMPPAKDVPIERLPILDKLGARLAFERTGVRLYQAMISKHDAFGSFRGGPSRADLEHIRDEEQRHLVVAQNLILKLGGDPTVITPCANLQAVVGYGVYQVLVDPRTTLIECLDAIIVAELSDHESWQQLARSIAPLGDKQAESQIREAERVETEHLTKVRAWLVAATALMTRPAD
jgi:rubrerythrin